MQPQHIEQVVQKLQALTPNRINEVEDFIDFLSQRDSDRQLTQAAMNTSETALNIVWDNTNDAEYDKL
ncbi:MAG: toxin-antitoxin system, antitoxin component, Xre family protein [Gammaproteobacteria bacterium]|nr:toxin-antitoxin system, antitoxin component, Xre family protein [Gammaproteobacteria bacterium]